MPLSRSARTSIKWRISTFPLEPVYGPSAAGFQTRTIVDHGPHVVRPTVSSSGDAVSDEKLPAPEVVRATGDGVTVLQRTAPVAAMSSSTLSPAARTANKERGWMRIESTGSVPETEKTRVGLESPDAA